MERETKNVGCLQHQTSSFAERAAQICALQRGRKHLVCSVAATTSPPGGNVKAVALHKPSGELLRVYTSLVHQGDLCTRQSESHDRVFM